MTVQFLEFFIFQACSSRNVLQKLNWIDLVRVRDPGGKNPAVLF